MALSLGDITKGFVDSKLRLVNENGDLDVESGVNSLTLGLKSIKSDTLNLLIYGISLENLSFVYEFTEKKSPVFPLATWYLSNITNNFFEGTADFAFLTILE